MSEPLIVRHRPKVFAEICGHQEAIAALQRRLAEPGAPHTYLLTGPSGVGKTTIARLIAGGFGAAITEVDAATHTGVEAMRGLVDDSAYLAAGTTRRMIIVDECHRLSPSAWDAALKTLEEPPEHLYWALCTTELHRVRDTVVTRSYHIPLDRLSDQAIEEFLLDIMIAEGWTETVRPEVFRLVAIEAQGSPRQALTLLQTCYDAPDIAEAQRIIALQSSTEPMRQILAMLVDGRGKWAAIQPMLAQLSDSDFSEGALIGACRYVIAALNHQTDERRARRLWELLAALTYPSHGHDPKSLFYAAVGRILWGDV